MSFNLRKSVYLSLILVVALSTQFAFAGGRVYNDWSEYTKYECKVQKVSESDEQSLKLSTHEVDKYLDTSWTELYTDGNWFDAKANVRNVDGNPGSIDVKVEVYDGLDTKIHCSYDGLSPECTWTSAGIASCYKHYTVYVRASSNSGVYTIRYWDEPN